MRDHVVARAGYLVPRAQFSQQHCANLRGRVGLEPLRRLLEFRDLCGIERPELTIAAQQMDLVFIPGQRTALEGLTLDRDLDHALSRRRTGHGGRRYQYYRKYAHHGANGRGKRACRQMCCTIVHTPRSRKVDKKGLH